MGDGHGVSDILDHMSPLARGGRRGGDLDRFGSFVVVEKLATGGMAELYKVRDLTGRVFTLKCIRGDCDDDPEFRRMLRDEAKITASLAHPNINRVVDIVEDRGQLGLILEYVDGIDTSRLRRHLDKQGTPLRLELVVHLVREVLLGLDYAHAARDHDGTYLHVVHRDISPGNVMVTVDGGTKIVDWGIARAQNRLAKTEAGNVKGKFRYMSPEQIRGDTVGAGADIYATAIFLWELLAGRRIYDEVGVAQLMIKVANAHVPPLSQAREGLPKALERVYDRATHKDPESRYLSSRAFADALDAVLLEYDAERCRAELGGIVTAIRRKDSLEKFDRAVARARVAAEHDLEDAILSALEEPDRVERVDASRATPVDGGVAALTEAMEYPPEPPTMPMAQPVTPESGEIPRY